MSQCQCGKPKDKRSRQCQACYKVELAEKLCRGCNTVYPIESYNLRPNGRGGHKRRSRCKQCEAKQGRVSRAAKPPLQRKSATRQWEKANPDKHLMQQLRTRCRQKGITNPLDVDFVSQYLFRVKSCEICGKALADAGPQHKRSLCIDHHHEGGHFRGALCSKCNTGLGYFDDDPVLLEKAIQYIQRRPPRPPRRRPVVIARRRPRRVVVVRRT